MRGFLLLSLGVFSFSALAADLPGSHDLDILPRFPRAEIVDFRQAPSEERIYPLGRSVASAVACAWRARCAPKAS